MVLKLNCKDLAFQIEQFGKDYDKRVDVGYRIINQKSRAGRFALRWT